jgi:hypothetical protein
VNILNTAVSRQFWKQASLPLAMKPYWLLVGSCCSQARKMVSSPQLNIGTPSHTKLQAAVAHQEQQWRLQRAKQQQKLGLNFVCRAGL